MNVCPTYRQSLIGFFTCILSIGPKTELFSPPHNPQVFSRASAASKPCFLCSVYLPSISVCSPARFLPSSSPLPKVTLPRRSLGPNRPTPHTPTLLLYAVRHARSFLVGLRTPSIVRCSRCTRKDVLTLTTPFAIRTCYGVLAVRGQDETLL